MNSYELSRAFIDWAFENPHKVKPIHYAIYFFAIEHCNRLGWKKVFGFPSNMAMEAIGVKNWRTYSAALNDLVEFGFIEMVQVSKNQHSSNIVALVKNTKATTKAQSKALDKALSKHSQKQSTKQGQSTVSIDKQETIEQLNNEPLNNKPTLLCSFSSKTELDNDIDKATFSFWELFKSNLLEAGINKTTLLDKATLEKWRVPVKLMMEKDSRTVTEFTEVFKFLKTNAFWKKNIQSTEKLREKFERLLVEARQKPESKKDKPLIEPHHAERIARNLRGQ